MRIALKFMVKLQRSESQFLGFAHAAMHHFPTAHGSGVKVKKLGPENPTGYESNLWNLEVLVAKRAKPRHNE